MQCLLRFFQVSALGPGDQLLDIGSGDGTVVGAAAMLTGACRGGERVYLSFLSFSLRTLTHTHTLSPPPVHRHGHGGG
jgi:hypothetical protein